MLDTLDARCDHDTIEAWRNPAPPAPAASITASVGADPAAVALLDLLPPPGPAIELDPTRLLDTMPGIEPTHLEPVHP